MSVAMESKASDVYGIGRDLPLNYVSRDSVDGLLINSLARDKHIVVYGSSKQGKTSLRKHCLLEKDCLVIHCSNKWALSDLQAAILKKAGFEITQSSTRTATGKNKIVAALKATFFSAGIETAGENELTTSDAVTKHPLEIDPEDVNDIITALGDIKQFIVLEDFHYLPTDTQKDFAVALKAFHEQSNLCFLIVGVWLEESRLTVFNGDLTGRIVGINADKWSKAELKKVIEVGEELLNIKFTDPFKDAVLSSCLDSVHIVQEACYQALVKKNIYFKQDSLLNLGDGIDVSVIIREVVNQQTGRYNSFITQFAAGFQETALQMYKWLLFPVLTEPVTKLEEGLSFREMKIILREHHPEGNALNLGNLTQALQATASLQVKKDIKPIVLDYDQTNQRLNVVDRGFLIWIDNQNRNELLELADLPRNKISI
jgi:hypothetical protein